MTTKIIALIFTCSFFTLLILSPIQDNISISHSSIAYLCLSIFTFAYALLSFLTLIICIFRITLDWFKGKVKFFPSNPWDGLEEDAKIGIIGLTGLIGWWGSNNVTGWWELLWAWSFVPIGISLLMIVDRIYETK